MSEHENAPAAPPEGEALPCKKCGGLTACWCDLVPGTVEEVLKLPRMVADARAALAAATARADADRAALAEADEQLAELKAEAERLRGENATLEAHVASLVWHAERWLELRKVAVVTRNEDGELGLMAFLPEPNPRPLDIAVTAPEEVEAEVNIAFDLPRALPATPAPRRFVSGEQVMRHYGAATPAPGPSAEAEWIVAESEGGASVGVGVYRSTDGENARPLVYFGYEEQGTDDEDEAIRRANQRARVVAAALNALTRAPGGQDA